MLVRSAVLRRRVKEIPSFEFEREYGAGKLRAVSDGLEIVKTILGEFLRHKAMRFR